VLLLDADPDCPPRLRCRRQVKQRLCMLFSIIDDRGRTQLTIGVYWERTGPRGGAVFISRTVVSTIISVVN
jgi:hypothetical protein